MKKFELALETEVQFGDIKLFRVRALVSFGKVKAGDLGGYVERESNLSQEGNSWVFEEAKVSGNARVCGYACVYGNAWVSGDAHVSGDAFVSGYACVSGYARVCGNARVCGYACVSGNAQVFDDACVSGNARVSGNAWVSGNAHVSGDAFVSGYACVSGYAEVSGNVKVFGNACVSGNAKISKFFEIKNITNLKYNFTSLPKGVQIGCEFHSMKEWNEKYLEIGKKYGFSEEMSKEYLRFMKAVRRVQRFEAKEAKK